VVSATTERVVERRPSARRRLLDAAGDLFYAEGVQSVGIDRIIEQAGVAKASLYNTFGSKEVLVRAYLDEQHAGTVGRLSAALASTGVPREQVLAVVAAQADFISEPGFRGCAFVAAASEAPDGGLVEKASYAYRGWIRGMFLSLAGAPGAAAPDLLAAQLRLIYDGPAFGPGRTVELTPRSPPAAMNALLDTHLRGNT
jgi:AcrR family transcriptional regulator